jgi:two-component system sensor histidine kinase/response regulator
MSLDKEEVVVVPANVVMPKVLIVEDQADTANALAEFLAAENFQPVIAEDVFSALESLTKEALPDIIISDIYMPGKSGIDLFSELKKNPGWSDIPFIVLSGKSDEEFMHKSICLGCDHFIRKPVHPPELKALLLGKLQQKETRRALENLKLEHFKKKVIHSLSHEFRTPLVSITTGTELLLEEADNLPSSQVRSLLQSILRGGLRLERLVEDFMLIQQIEIGQAADSYNEFVGPVSLGEFVSRLKEKEAEVFSEQYADREFRIEVDRSLLKRNCAMFLMQLIDAFVRIIDNAYKFSPEKRRCMITISEENHNACFTIRDWGVGLPDEPKAEEEAVEKFIQIRREVHEQQGSGIGLSIASYFVSLHGGQVTLVRPGEETGLEVRVKIPFIS